MDSDTMLPKGEKAELLHARPQEHGYERLSKQPKGVFEKILSGTFIEGAFVNKYKGKYYLQYASPSTSEHIYNNAVYVSEKPLGPYRPQKHNPFSSKPGGFITGAGHGSTIQDKYGNWWHAASMRISVNRDFERRIGIFPAGFDQDGTLYCNQNFADYPVVVPEGRFNPQDVKPEWMLLSYMKQGTASSSIEGHEPQKALNEDIRTCWCADRSDSGEWYQVDLEAEYEVHAIQINFADYQVPKLKRKKDEYGGAVIDRRYIDTDSRLRTRYLMEGSLDGKNWFILEDKRTADTDLPHDYFVYEAGKQIRYISITAEQLPYGKRFALSGVRVFGKGRNKKPVQAIATAKRIGDMDAVIEWRPIEDAQGCNIRYGIAPDKLYSSWLVYGAEHLELTTLCKGREYFVAVDSFNENGVSEGGIIKIE